PGPPPDEEPAAGIRSPRAAGAASGNPSVSAAGLCRESWAHAKSKPGTHGFGRHSGRDFLSVDTLPDTAGEYRKTRDTEPGNEYSGGLRFRQGAPSGLRYPEPQLQEKHPDSRLGWARISPSGAGAFEL